MCVVKVKNILKGNFFIISETPKTVSSGAFRVQESDFKKKLEDPFQFLDTQVSLAPTSVRPSVSKSVCDSFGFSFCQRPSDLTKRLDDIVVADMVVDMAADMEVHMLADIEVDKIANML